MNQTEMTEQDRATANAIVKSLVFNLLFQNDVPNKFEMMMIDEVMNGRDDLACLLNSIEPTIVV